MLVDELEQICEHNEGTKKLKADVENHRLSSDDTPYDLSLRIDTIRDPKEVFKYIKKCEQLIRISPEYKQWIAYIYEVMGLTSCQVTGENIVGCSLQVHHHPITLFTAVQGVVNRHLMNNISFCSMDIAIEVLQLHYSLRVPFIVLITSIHEKYHNQAIDLPSELINGDIKYFIETYGQYIDEEELQNIRCKLKVNFENCGWKNGKYDWVEYEK